MSLLNFNPAVRSEITTPRSKKVLATLGLVVQDLYYPTREEILQQGVQFEDVDYYVEAKLQHMRDRVDRFLDLVRQEYNNNSEDHARNSQSSQLQLSQSFMQKQEQMLRTLQNKQKIEIEREIQTEMKIEEMKRKNQIKEQRIEELKKMREEEFHQRMQEKEEKLKLREQKLKQAKLQADIHNETIMRKFQEEEIKIQQKQAKYALMKQMEKEEREREIQEKMNMRAQRMAEQELQIQQENQIRQQEYNKKLQNMEQMLLEKQQYIRQQNQLKEERAREKYQNATAQKQLETYQMEQRIHSKEKDIQMRNTMQEFNRQQLLQQKRNQEQQKHYMMEQKKLIISQEQHRRNQEYFSQEKERELKKSRLEEQKKIKRDESSLILQSHMEEVQMKQRYLDKQTELENQRIIALKQQQFLNAEELRQKNILNMKRKYVQELLKLEDAAQNYQIQKRKEQYKNAVLLDRFEETDRRLKQQQNEYQKLQETKKQMEINIQNEKIRILAEFDKKKLQLAEERSSQQISQIIKPNPTDRLPTNKPIKTKSATSFHLPPAKEQKEPKLPSENRSTNNKSKRTIDEKSMSTTSQKKRHYFISEETMKAVQLYANGEILKQFQIEIRPNKKKR
ncbi:unnamed protein product [Paramecium primaurelia]|uniref:Uncharacterized protein n=1 Tax=Paramecium primaurelia TaxID=5886 RepID=A0A8S1Q823_PARPR|nr:unnamed protein product [Paramecium primaurelia]